MKLANTITGVSIIVGGLGLAAVSGAMGFEGFVGMTKNPLFGWISPVVAFCLVPLGVAFELSLKSLRRSPLTWVQPLALLAFIAAGAGIDQHSGEMALAAKVNVAAQDAHDRKTEYDTAVAALATATTLTERLDDQLAIMTGEDTIAAQHLLGVKEDGDKGKDTIAAFKIKSDQIRADLVPAREDVRKYTAVVGKGEPVTELPLTLDAARWIASGVTFGSVLLAFFGSLFAFGFRASEVVMKEDAKVAETVRDVRTAVRSHASAFREAAAALRAKAAA